MLRSGLSSHPESISHHFTRKTLTVFDRRGLPPSTVPRRPEQTSSRRAPSRPFKVAVVMRVLAILATSRGCQSVREWVCRILLNPPMLTCVIRDKTVQGTIDDVRGPLLHGRTISWRRGRRFQRLTDRRRAGLSTSRKSTVARPRVALKNGFVVPFTRPDE